MKTRRCTQCGYYKPEETMIETKLGQWFCSLICKLKHGGKFG